MSEKDFNVSVTGVPNVGHISRKPSYLITMEGFKGKSKNVSYFITLDKPDCQNNFVQAKGIYSDLDEEEIIKRFSDILSLSPKENILDMMFPIHRVYSIRSLVFNANKASTLIR